VQRHRRLRPHLARGRGEALLASLLCADAKTLIATWRPWLAPGERWTLAKLDLTLALGLAHADRPLLAALAETADPAAYDAVIAWIGSDGTWTSKAVATTRPGVHVQSVSGLLDTRATRRWWSAPRPRVSGRPEPARPRAPAP
jgi:hypothetical protein